jgi:hypothetical protein
MKQIVLAAITLALSGCAPPAPGIVVGGYKASVDDVATLINEDQRRKATIESFASLAAQSNIEGLMRLIVPAAKEEVGEQAYRSGLIREVIPFFADYQELGSQGIAPATFPDGRKGAAYYTYIVTKTGALKPFSIWLLDEGDRTLVGYIDVNRCIRGRHPVCE